MNINFMLFFLLILAIPVAYLCVSLRLVHRTESAIKDATFKTICPNCHRQVQPKSFLCPECGTTNTLVPDDNSPYYQSCRNCGHQLPKTVKKGRALLKAICPECQYILGSGIGSYKEIIVPIVGGPSTGKSAFLSAWVEFAYRHLSTMLNAAITFPFPGDERIVRSILAHWSKGIRPDKTSNRMPSGFGMDIIPSDRRTFSRLYCYDPAGECFDNIRGLLNFTYYDYMDVVIFLIDPFSVPNIRKKYASQLKESYSEGFQYSDRDMNDYCDRFINSLKLYHELGSNEYHPAFCAVVITKVDMFDLDQLIGAQAASMLQKEMPTLDEDEAIDLACTNFLEKIGFGDILYKLNDHFSDVCCFSVSSFGHMPDTGKAYQPIRVERPFLWLMRKILQTKNKSLFKRLIRK